MAAINGRKLFGGSDGSNTSEDDVEVVIGGGGGNHLPSHLYPASTGSTSLKELNITYSPLIGESLHSYLSDAVTEANTAKPDSLFKQENNTKKTYFYKKNNETILINRPHNCTFSRGAGRNFRSLPWFRAVKTDTGWFIERKVGLKPQKRLRSSEKLEKILKERKALPKEFYHERLLPEVENIVPKIGKPPVEIYAYSVSAGIFLKEGMYRGLENPNQRVSALLQILIEVAEGLAELNKLGYYHRDIKPQNILIFQRKDWSFGARLIDLDDCVKIGSVGETFVRTDGYLPPETTSKETQTKYGDYYALGKVLGYFGKVLGVTIQEYDTLIKELMHKTPEKRMQPCILIEKLNKIKKSFCVDCK
ncbi:MAG: hypothetical protein SP1CHLAM54_14580 [Chlamydiia bacterium]|nr:hypothetical protein [Chlamydiia bacterium]MCH9616349.1 hypothetical protein [Chlamydiia bacterium]MCH9629665.1 hypothetical protein [Chlamydiia bacterium]